MFETSQTVNKSKNQKVEIYIPHMLHVWYIYLQNWMIFRANVGKYSIDWYMISWDPWLGWQGSGGTFFSACLSGADFCSFLRRYLLVISCSLQTEFHGPFTIGLPTVQVWFSLIFNGYVKLPEGMIMDTTDSKLSYATHHGSWWCRNTHIYIYIYEKPNNKPTIWDLYL